MLKLLLEIGFNPNRLAAAGYGEFYPISEGETDIDFQQNRAWEDKKNETMVKKLEELRKHLITFVQPRLAWEVSLLEINCIN